MEDTVQVSKEKSSSPDEKNASRPRLDIQLQGEELVSVPSWGDGKITTLWNSFEWAESKFANNPMLGTRKYEGKSRGDYVWETYSQVKEKAVAVGKGLSGLDQKHGEAVGIFAENRSEWVISQLGIFSRGMRVVSLYATLGDKAVEFITNHAEIKTVFVSKSNLAGFMHVLGTVSHTTEEGNLRTIVQFDPNEFYGNSGDTVDEADVAACEAQGIRLIGLSTLIAEGNALTEVTPDPPTPEDWAFIMYTSGTTGTPKGAILTHENLVATLAVTGSRFTLSEEDRHISYLPLAHIFETVVEQALFAKGGRVGFFQGNIKKLTLDQLALRPTIWCGVPRVFDKVYKKIMAGIADKSCIGSSIAGRAFAVQTDLCRQSATERDDFYDGLVFKKICTELLGLEQVRYIITGAAPCPPYLMEFLRVLIGCPVIQGYGMTETSAAAAIMSITDITTGHNGAPLPCNEIKLVDVEEMEYLHTDTPFPRGEVWIRGKNIFKGYYKNPEATAKDLTADGWLKTGDVGQWNPNGTLSIIDRKKNVFKLSIGEYIAAEKVEAVYGKSPIVSQIFIYGNSFKSHILAVVVPNAAPTFRYFREQKWWPAPTDGENHDDPAYILSPAFLAVFNTVATEHAAELTTWVHTQLRQEEKSLKSFEKPRSIFVCCDIDKDGQGFTEANECITPTFKLRRPFLLNRFVTQLQAMYTANNEPPSADEHWPGVKIASTTE